MHRADLVPSTPNPKVSNVRSILVLAMLSALGDAGIHPEEVQAHNGPEVFVESKHDVVETFHACNPDDVKPGKAVPPEQITTYTIFWTYRKVDGIPHFVVDDWRIGDIPHYWNPRRNMYEALWMDGKQQHRSTTRKTLAHSIKETWGQPGTDNLQPDPELMNQHILPKELRNTLPGGNRLRR